MAPEDYQAADHAVLAGWLADATLTTQLEAIYDWAGWHASLEAADAAMTEPNLGEDLPVGGGFYQISYPQEVKFYHSGAVQPRRVALDLYLRTQPTASSSAWTDALTAASKIKSRIEAQATDAAVPNTTAPLVPIRARRSWPHFRLLLSAWMKET